MSSWHFFGYLKSLTVEPLFNSEMVHSYFLLRGRLAFVWRQAHIAGWLSTVGERSVLAIRPYLYWLNQLSSLADAKGLPFFHPSFDIFIHIFGDSFWENDRYKSPSGFAGGATIKISHIYRGFDIRCIYPLSELSVSEHLDKPIVTASDWSQISNH
jgi:hypothetical protein